MSSSLPVRFAEEIGQANDQIPEGCIRTSLRPKEVSLDRSVII